MAIRNTLVSICLFVLLHESLYQYAKADVHFHSPRGSNNRLNGDKENRKNANRVFDSQVSHRVRGCYVHRQGRRGSHVFGGQGQYFSDKLN